MKFANRLERLSPYVPGEQPKIEGLIKLNTNENPFPPAPGVKEAVLQAAENLQKYSDPEASALCQALAETFGLKKEEVICGNGSDEILAFAFLAFCDKDHPAVFPRVTYGFYEVLANLFQVPTRRFELQSDLSIDPAECCQKGETVFLANPNAPTGILMPLSSVERILKADPDRVVVLDEAYADFAPENGRALIERYENLLIVRTFSKSRSLAGGRLGFALGNQKLIEGMRRIKDSFHPYNVNAMTQAAGISVLKAEAYTKKTADQVIKTRERTKKVLKDQGFELTDSAANFLFLKKAGFEGKALVEELRKKKILVRHFNTPGIEDYLRVSVGSEEEMEFFLKAITELTATEKQEREREKG